jgi:hypothetical protein
MGRMCDTAVSSLDAILDVPSWIGGQEDGAYCLRARDESRPRRNWSDLMPGRIPQCDAACQRRRADQGELVPT